MQKEKRSLDISWRVFSKDDIRRIAQFLYDSFQEAQKDDRHSSLTYQLNCEGGISYESDSMSLFDDGGPLDLKKTITLQMTFRDYEEDNYIDLTLRESGYLL